MKTKDVEEGNAIWPNVSLSLTHSLSVYAVCVYMVVWVVFPVPHK